MPRQQVVTTFSVARLTLKRWLVQQRTTADLTPKRSPGRRRAMRSDHHAALWVQVQTYPDATIAEHTQRWNETQGTHMSQWTVGRAIRRLGWTRKKRRWVPPSGMNTNGATIGNGSPNGRATIL